MHPLFQNRNSLFAYFFAWLPLGAMLGVVISAAAHLDWRATLSVIAPVTLLLAFVCLSPWYLCRALPLIGTPRWKLLSHHWIAAMFASALVLFMVPFLLQLLEPVRPGIERQFEPAMRVLAGMCFLFFLLSVAFHYVLQALEASRQAEVLSREAELKALKAQVNPHFLFNSLNSISALTTIDPAKAREMCIRLSDFLRNSLRLGERTSIPFGEELALAGTYLDVEQVRFGRRLRVVHNFDAACDACEVPPLLVQPLVENAIKHGIASLAEGGEISMSAQIADGRLRFSVENPFDPDAPAQRKSGFGLVNVRNRLRARYGHAARLDIDASAGTYRVHITVPFIKEAVKE
jgi:two-component system, LytTR family, sensor histidine kinase AlgZ